METEKICSVQQYLDMLKKVEEKHGEKREYGGKNVKPTVDFCYRGLKNIDYKLCPRAVNEQLCRVEGDEFDQPVEQFRKEASGYLRGTCGDDKLLWMQYAQHFGVPTRLLDFTSNPLVALYFACAEGEKDGVVWMINTFNYMRKAINDYQKKGHDEPLSDGEYFPRVFKSVDEGKLYPAYFVPEYIDVRMNAQASRFMIWPQTSFDLEDLIEEENFMPIDSPIDDEKAMYQFAFKMTIANEYKKVILHELDLLGINEKTLFPGVDSIGNYINYLFKPN